MARRTARTLGGETLFRIAGLLAIASIGASTLLVDNLPAAAPKAAIAVVRGVEALFLVAFGAVFWRVVSRGPAERVEKRTVALVVAQAVLGLLVSTDLLFVVAAELAYVLPRRVAYAVFAAEAAGTVAIGLVLEASGRFEAAPSLAASPPAVRVGLTLFTVLAFQAFAFAAGALAAEERRGRDELARRTAELAATQELLASSARVAERVALSRELHDTVGHHLTLLSVQLEIAKKTSEGTALAAATQAQRVVKLLLADVREVVAGLRETGAIDLGAALARLHEGLPGPAVTVAGPRLVVTPEAGHVLFRVAQEALTNARRHAGASRVAIEAAEAGGRVRLTVTDDGRGASAYAPGHGLTGLAGRVAELGGAFRAGPLEGGGFRVEAEVPAGAGPEGVP